MKKLKALPIIFAILINLVPLQAFADIEIIHGIPEPEEPLIEAPEAVYKIGNVILDNQKSYYKNGKAIEYCDFDNDDDCTLFYHYRPQQYRTLYMKNYTGPEISLIADTIQHADIKFMGNNTINSESEFGFYFPGANKETTTYFDPQDNNASLTINVNSKTEKAIGIYSERSNLYFKNKAKYEININSALPEEKISTSEVAGIRVDNHGSIQIDERSKLTINNPTGNYSIYGDTIRIATTSMEYCKGLGGNERECDANFVFTHKITDGVGDVIPGNDFVEEEQRSEKIAWTNGYYTFDYIKTDNLGTFRLIPRINGVNAELVAEIMEDMSFDEAEKSLKNTLVRYDNIKELLEEYDQNHYDSIFYRVSPEISYLINETKPEDKNKIKLEDKYAFYAGFETTDQNHGFESLSNNHCGIPFSDAIINETVYSCHSENRTRNPDNPFKEWFKLEISVKKKEESIEKQEEPTEEKPEEKTEEDPKKELKIMEQPKIEKSKNLPMLPILAPNTGILTHEETNSKEQSLTVLMLITISTSVLQLAYYGKTILSLRRNGVRKNHATPSSSIQLRGKGSSSLRH